MNFYQCAYGNKIINMTFIVKLMITSLPIRQINIKLPRNYKNLWPTNVIMLALTIYQYKFNKGIQI